MDRYGALTPRVRSWSASDDREVRSVITANLAPAVGGNHQLAPFRVEQLLCEETC
jgi:hypothetical protein